MLRLFEFRHDETHPGRRPLVPLGSEAAWCRARFDSRMRQSRHWRGPCGFQDRGAQAWTRVRALASRSALEFARTQIEVNLCEVRMRRQWPCRFDHFRRLADASLAGRKPRGERDRRHKIRRALTAERARRRASSGSVCSLSRAIAVVSTARCRSLVDLVDQIRRPAVIERRQCAFPVLRRDMAFQEPRSTSRAKR